MISTSCLAALRIAASLAHTLPGLRVTISDEGRTLVDVRAVDIEETAPSDEALVMSPCAFRGAVGRGHRLHQAGRPLELLPATHGCDPTITIGTPIDGEARPGGLFRVPQHDQQVWGFGTTLDADIAYPLGHDLVEEAQPLSGVRGFGLRQDKVTDATVVFAHTDADIDSASEANLVDLLESLLARWTVHELITGGLGVTDDDRAV